MQTAHQQRGVTLVEMLGFLFVMTTLIVVVIAVLSSLSTSYRSIRAAEAVESGAVASLDRMVRSIRDATSTNSFGSTFGTSPGALTLNIVNASGTAQSVQFATVSTSNGLAIHEYDNSTDIGPLTSSSTRVTNLVFYRIITPKSQAVKISLTLEAGTSTHYRSATFNVTAVLRGSYPAQ